MITGIPTSITEGMKYTKGLVDLVREHEEFFIEPLPNLYFTRDPGASIGTGVSISSMTKPARRREPLLLYYIYKYHPEFQSDTTPLWHDYKEESGHLEGGDELILSKNVIAIGHSERSSIKGIENLATRLFNDEKSTVKEVLVVEIPKARTYMHLDTVFTMVDHDKFTIFPGIEKHLNIYRYLGTRTY